MKIRWLLSHEPIELFKRAAASFSKEVQARTNGEIEIEVLTLTDFSNKYNEGVPVNHYDALDLLRAGKVEMSQTYTTYLGQHCKDMYVLDLPFLFRNHDHAGKVLDSEIGAQLMAGLRDQTDIKGLAFTYSGGFRIIPSTRAINKLSDFEGMKLRVCRSPVAVDTFRAIGADPQPMKIEDATDAVRAGKIEAAESTYPRIYSMEHNTFSHAINKTEHSLFLTTIIMSGPFWDGLTAEQKTVISEAAHAAATVERQESIDDIEITEKKCALDGIHIVSMPADEQEKFKAATQVVHDKYETYFTPGLVKKIKDLH
jgi:TRAP-type C4-dicarboxylate transport system substrate-binding protein